MYSKHTKDKIPGFVRKPLLKSGRSGTVALLCLALIAVILSVYMQVGDNQFLNFDDDVYVTNNLHVERGITGRNVVWAFTSFDAANWQDTEIAEYG